MNKQSITDVQVRAFLRDYAENSETTILEEGNEKDEILAIAAAKGIELKKQEDLAGFKTIYTFADRANGNKMRLPKEKLLKALPGLIGKPVDIDHNRRYVVGHYIDYKYRQKDDMVIAYGVFYKSNFESEWEEAKRLFKEKKLATSYEIWCPKEKRIPLPDGTLELSETEIAGGALLFRTKPAFKDSKVLALAKENIDKMSEQMVFASKYSDEDILCIASEQDVATPPAPTPVATKAKCANCGHEFDNTNVGNQVRCSDCLAILDKSGTMLYPPQIIDFQVGCSNCRSRNWLLLEKKDNTAKIQCQSCAKKYDVAYDKSPEVGEDISKLNFLYVGSTSCPQCGRYIGFSGTHRTTKYDLKCIKCGLSFSHDISREHVKKITKIEEIVPKAEPPVAASAVKSAEEKGEPKMALNRTKYHRYFEGESFDDFTKTLLDDYSDDVVVASKLTYEQKQGLKDSDFAVVVRTKNKKTGEMRKIRKYPIQDEAHVRNAMARLGQQACIKELESLGVLVETVRAKVLARAKTLGMTEMVKEHMAPAQAAVEPKPAEPKVEAPVVPPAQEAKPVVEPKVEATPVQAGQEPKPVEPKVETPAPVTEPKKPEDKPVEAKKEETPKVEEKPKEEPKPEKKPVSAARCKVSKKIKDLRKAAKETKKLLAKASEDAEKRVEFYKVNAIKIKTRRDELMVFANELTDEDIVNDEKYTDAKVKKENAALATSSETVGTKPHDEGYFKNLRNDIDDKAFGRKKRN